MEHSPLFCTNDDFSHLLPSILFRRIDYLRQSDKALYTFYRALFACDFPGEAANAASSFSAYLE